MNRRGQLDAAAPDNDLMTEVRNGDAAKLAVLFERHHRALFQYLARLAGDREAGEDLVQEAFFRMLKYAHTFEPRHEFSSWMYRIARNVHLDSVRKRKPELVRFDERRPEPDSGTNVEEGLGRRQQVALMRRALAALPLEKREVLLLSRFQNLKYDQIAEILDCEPGTVKVRVFRAIRDLGQIYTELSGERAS